LAGPSARTSAWPETAIALRYFPAVARLSVSLRETSSIVSPFGFSASSSRIRPISRVPRSVSPPDQIAAADYLALLPNAFTHPIQSS
jgi:hypothetical protein